MQNHPTCKFLCLLLLTIQIGALLAAAAAPGSAVLRVDCVSRLKGPFTFQDGGSNQTFTTVPGDVLTMTVVAADTGRTPLRVRWPGMDDWTNASTYTYTVAMSDVRLITPLWLYVSEANASSSGGVVGAVPYQIGQLNVTDGRQPAALQRVWVALASNGSQVLDGSALWVGTKIRVVALGQDPMGLPMQFMFWVSRDCSMGPRQEWSASSSFNYTVTAEDMTPCTRLNAAVRNNDGWGHFDGTLDGFDDWAAVAINVTDGMQPPSFKGLTIADVSGTLLPSTTALQPGSTIVVTASAVEPAGMPLEYKFTITRDCSMTSTTVQEWSASSSTPYLVSAEDVTSCTSITALVRRRGDQRVVVGSASLLVGWLPTVQQLTILDAAGSPVGMAADGVASEVAPGTQLSMQALAYDESGRPMQYLYLLLAADHALQLDRWTPAGIVKASAMDATKGPPQGSAGNSTTQGQLLAGPHVKQIAPAWSTAGAAVYSVADTDTCQVLVLLVRNSDGVPLLVAQGVPGDMAVALPVRTACGKQRAPEGDGALLGQAEAPGSPADLAAAATITPPPVVKNAARQQRSVGYSIMAWLSVLVLQLL